MDINELHCTLYESLDVFSCSEIVFCSCGTTHVNRHVSLFVDLLKINDNMMIMNLLKLWHTYCWIDISCLDLINSLVSLFVISSGEASTGTSTRCYERYALQHQQSYGQR